MNRDIQQIALLDAKRAVRLVRHHAAVWGIDPDRLGVANLIPARYKNGFPGAQWPKRLMKWLGTLPVE